MKSRMIIYYNCPQPYKHSMLQKQSKDIFIGVKNLMKKKTKIKIKINNLVGLNALKKNLKILAQIKYNQMIEV